MATLMSVITGPRLVFVATLVRYVENVNRRGPFMGPRRFLAFSIRLVHHIYSPGKAVVF